MRSLIWMNATAAWRTSSAPSTLENATGRPLPKLSAAAASRRSDLTWLRKKIVATAKNRIDEPIIQKMKM